MQINSLSDYVSEQAKGISSLNYSPTPMNNNCSANYDMSNITLLVLRLGFQCLSEVQNKAAIALGTFARAKNDYNITVATAGAISPLVALLGPQNSATVQENAAGALRYLAIYINNNINIAAAGAIPYLVALLGPQNSATMQENAAGTLENLAAGNEYNSINIAAAGAIPPLVALLGPQNPAGVQESVAGALRYLAYDNSDNQVNIAAAGAILPLVALLGPRSKVKVQQVAALALEYLALNTANRVLIRSAGGVTALNHLIQTTADKDVRLASKGALDAINSG